MNQIYTIKTKAKLPIDINWQPFRRIEWCEHCRRIRWNSSIFEYDQPCRHCGYYQLDGWYFETLEDFESYCRVGDGIEKDDPVYCWNCGQQHKNCHCDYGRHGQYRDDDDE